MMISTWGNIGVLIANLKGSSSQGQKSAILCHFSTVIVTFRTEAGAVVWKLEMSSDLTPTRLHC